MPYSKMLFAAALIAVRLGAQSPAAPRPGTFPQPAPPREVKITPIPGVIAEGVQWKIAFQSAFNADGITGTKDGGLLFAQEQKSQINRIDKNDKFAVYLANGHGVGSVAIGPKNRVIAVERTCTDPGQKPDQCQEPTGIAQLQPERKVLGNSIDGKTLGRVNDLVVSTKGDVYFTSGGAFRVGRDGKVSQFGQNLRTNGIMLSPDEKTLYVTNGPTIAAFDIAADGIPSNQREFGKLEAGGNGDGLAVDAMGRLYSATAPGVQVWAPDGKYLGLIPTPRGGISMAFSGQDKKMLYLTGNGGVDESGKEITAAPGVRVTAMTIYKIPVLTQGFKGRAK